MPLADRARPHTFDEMAGQKHLLAKNAPFRRIIESGHLPSLVFYGPPGTGKTTAADIVAAVCGKQFHKINATVASISEVKEILTSSYSLLSTDGILLYIDEIQYFNKKQQQSLLEYVEDGRVTLICSTTENPYFALYGALLSRSTVFEFKPISPEELIPTLRRALDILNSDNGTSKTCSDKTLRDIASCCGGDARKAIGGLENIFYASGDELLPELATELVSRSGMRLDRDGDEHYDLLSAFQKSIRGSDQDAAIFYLARLLEGGDLLSPCRRLLVIASEDIGLAYPNAAAIVKSCVDSALQLGLPEASLPLSEAVIFLATAPKSNSAYMAYAAACEAIAAGKGMRVPEHLRDTHRPGAEGGYVYPHQFPNHYVEQQYLPDDLVGTVFYEYGKNKTEQAAAEYAMRVKKKP